MYGAIKQYEVKKLFGLIFGLMMVYGGFSQTYYNWDFQTSHTSTFPSGFVTWNLDSQTVDPFITQNVTALTSASGWVLDITDFNNPGFYTKGCAITGSGFTHTSVPSNRWLVTPPVNIPTGVPNIGLTWSAFSLGPKLQQSVYDNYEVLVSTTDSATTSFTTNLLTVIGEQGGTYALPLTQYAGQTIRVAFRDTTLNGYGLLIPQIKIVALPSDAAAIKDIEIYEHNYLNNPVIVTGKVKNTGLDTLNSYVLNYSVNGGAPVTTPVNGFGLVSQQSRLYIDTIPFNPTTAGTYTISVWFSGLNGSGSNSDTSFTTVFFYPQVAGLVKNVLIEEMTGAGCPACSGGALALRDLTSNNAHVIPVAIHSADINDLQIAPADAMQIADGETVIQNYLTQFPSALIDRLYTFDNQSSTINLQTKDGQNHVYVGTNTYLWDTLAAFRQIQATPVNVSLANENFDSATGSLSIDVKATFLQSLSQGTYNLNLYVVEDSVLTPSGNNGNGYNQDNGDYSRQVSGNSSLSAELYALPKVITDNGQPNHWAHNHVLRAMLGGPWGTTGIIPSAPVAGTTYSNTYSTTLPSTWRYDKVYLVGVVQEYNSSVNKRTVLNVVKYPVLGWPAGITETTEFNKLSVYPNPASTMATVLMDTKDHGLATISILNTLGETVVEPTDVLLNTGAQSANIPVGNLSTGLYFVKVSLNGEVKTLPLSIATR